MTESRGETRRPRWLVPALVWSAALLVVLALGLYSRPPAPPVPPGGGQVFPRVATPPDLRTLLGMLGVGSVVWYAVFIALPVLLWLARRTDIEARGLGRMLLAGAGAIALLVFATSFVQYAIVYKGALSRPTFAEYMPDSLRQNLLPWLALAGIVAAVESRRRAVRLAVERERLKSEVVTQRLVSLTSQLQPHFLFNTLQGISTLIHRDADAADEMLGRLADLLRDVLRDRDRVLVPLADEIQYARTYLEIASVRFADRLTWSIEVPSELDRAAVPLFVLQPLLENALNHGIGSRMRGGHIGVNAFALGGRMVIEISDDGAGLPSTFDERIGLANTRERLEASFGANQRFSLETRDGGGTIARIEVPIVAAK